MKENLISFKTAKLAKEKGFNLKTPQYYNTENPHSYCKDINEICILGLLHKGTLYEPQDEIDEESGISIYRLNYNIMYTPTQSLLQKWLKWEHNIHVAIYPIKNNDNQEIVYKGKICTLFTKNRLIMNVNNSPEYLLEILLFEGLKLIRI